MSKPTPLGYDVLRLAFVVPAAPIFGALLLCVLPERLGFCEVALVIMEIAKVENGLARSLFYASFPKRRGHVAHYSRIEQCL